MKKLIIASLLLGSISLSAQYALPVASPRQTLEQQFSLSKITVDYGRPAVKGRKIFGGLVPYNQVWRAGANSSTKLEIRQPLQVGTVTVPAGKYGLYIEPAENSWKIILNSDAQSWGTQYDASKNLYTATIPTAKAAERQEYFLITLEPVDDNRLDMTFTWDTTKAVLPITVPNPTAVAKMVDHLKQIRQVEKESLPAR